MTLNSWSFCFCLLSMAGVQPQARFCYTSLCVCLSKIGSHCEAVAPPPSASHRPELQAYAIMTGWFCNTFLPSNFSLGLSSPGCSASCLMSHRWGLDSTEPQPIMKRLCVLPQDLDSVSCDKVATKLRILVPHPLRIHLLIPAPFDPLYCSWHLWFLGSQTTVPTLNREQSISCTMAVTGGLWGWWRR